MTQSSGNNSGVVVAGLALFSMFFGAGDLIWPLILGGNVGSQNLFATVGLLITGVSLPLLGLISMMMFQGNYREFFGRIGKIPSLCLIFIVQIILGPLGSIPRLMTLSFATLKPYLPEDVSLIYFSLLASVLVLAFTIRPQKIVDILGYVLTPLLLICLAAILLVGFYNHPDPHEIVTTNMEAFSSGLNVGYNTLDLIASFIFAPLVLSHFISDNPDDTMEGRKLVFRKMLKASMLAAGILSVMYIGLTFVASYYTPLLSAHHPEERLSAIALYLLGPQGALVACFAVSMACLTTAIPLVSIFADYIRQDFFGNRWAKFSILLTLGFSVALVNIGFMGIANMLSPILQILCPSLIVLSLLNVCHKLYGTSVYRWPVFATFGLSVFAYIF